MENNQVLLSLCIPTNGVIHWVIPVLDSIFSQGIDASLYEVVITDNGGDSEFGNRIESYIHGHDNLKYFATNSYEFLNEIDSYKNASGKFIKFINHRTKLKEGTLKYLIDFVKNNEREKPAVYFSNGMIKNIDKIKECDSFDAYVKSLSYWSSWSTGMAFWKDDFDRIENYDNFNVLFPHTDILFHDKMKSKYLIDNTVLLEEIPTGKTPKGRYNLFHAFAVEYPAIICDLYRRGEITVDTFYKVKKDNLQFVKKLYFSYCFLKKKCSYDLSGIQQSLNVFYSSASIKRSMPMVLLAKCFKKTVYSLKGGK